MWTYEFSDGYKCKRNFVDFDEMIMDIAIMIRYHYKQLDPDIYADVLIYQDGKLNETVKGEEIE